MICEKCEHDGREWVGENRRGYARTPNRSKRDEIRSEPDGGDRREQCEPEMIEDWDGKRHSS